MMNLQLEAAAFRERQAEERRTAAQNVAFYLATGIDLRVALDGDEQQRHRTMMSLLRLLERERQRGLAGHWAYDLNRHVALKEALDRIKASLPLQPLRSVPPSGTRRSGKKKAAP
jgi:hypothetical protein